jgi:hypothetical protein
MTKKTSLIISLVLSSLLLSGCGKKPSVEFTNDEEMIEEFSPYTDELADSQIKITKDVNLSQEFTVNYKTQNPTGQGEASFKAISFEAIDSAGVHTADEGKKLVLVKIAVIGNRTNQGNPSTFNQVGANPSPQFVLIDKDKNKTYVEETYFSDAYTQDNDLFELSKITIDQPTWLSTAIVFQIDANLEADLAFRFINPEGDLEFYDVK